MWVEQTIRMMIEPRRILECAFSSITAIAAFAALVQPVAAQTPSSRAPGDPINRGSRGTVRITAGAEYDHASPVWRFFFGENWRDVWAREIEVPVLDLDAYAGGLTPFKSGGNQTHTLHMNGADGRRYVFRSVAKSVQQSLGDDLEHTAVGDIIQDQTSANHPSSATIANVVQNATGVVHPTPTLFILPDDDRLGEFRKEYAGMLGHLEIKPDDVEDGVEQFMHADKIQDADKLLENLESSLSYRLDARAYLKARLVDAIMGDFDRGADQWDFARFDSADARIYVPIARDRDWAFMRSNGALMRKVRSVYAKIGSYDPENEKLRSITFMTHEFDRSHLVSLPWSTWDSVATEIQSSLTDAVIDGAIAAQPAPYAAQSGAPIRAGLTARRDALKHLAHEFYEMVNEEADVFAADENERADVTQNADGSLTVQLVRLGATGNVIAGERPAFERTFRPDETKELRIYMQDGNDVVMISGNGPGLIKLRVTGGAGDDVFTDATTTPSGQQVEFYDAAGNNRFTRGPRTSVHTQPFVTVQPTTLDPDPKEKPRPREVKEERRGHFQDQWRIEGADFTTQRTQSISTRFWGATTTLSPVIDLRDGSGVVAGAGVARTDYGFRSEPFAARIAAHLMYATAAQRPGIDVIGEWHPRNTAFSITGIARATGFESQRFYGYGNNTTLVTGDAALVMRNELRLESDLHWGGTSNTQLTIGPRLTVSYPRFAAVSPAAASGAIGTSKFAAAGAQAMLSHSHVDHQSIPHTGYRGTVHVSASESLHNGRGAFGMADASVSAYIPLSRPTLALRASAQRAFGNFPIQEAAMMGGRTTLRGYRWQRFAGDAALVGNAEIRAPITRVELLVRGDLGIIALADAGRVWMNGVSSGGWHHSFGGGLSFASLSKAVSVVYARGEESRVYLNFGLPF
jgi:hypothetical protein